MDSKILTAYRQPFKYDDSGQMIFDADNHLVCQIRGWGHLKYKDNAVELQDGIGEELVKLLNRIEPGGSKVNFNGMRKSMVLNFNRVISQLQRREVKDDNLARYLGDLRTDIFHFLCVYEIDDPLFQDLSESTSIQLMDAEKIYDNPPTTDD